MADTSLRAETAHDNSERDEWHRLVAQLNTIEAIPADQTTDETIDLAGALSRQIMTTAAPDSEALLWKLDYLLEPARPDHDSPSWSKDFIMQTVEDYRRFLAGVGDQARPLDHISQPSNTSG